MPGKSAYPFTVLAMIFIALLATSCEAPTKKKTFTAEHIEQIKQVLTRLDPSRYRIVLPVFKGGEIVGSEVIGALPITRVRRMASTQDEIEYTETGNLQAIIMEQGAGTHTESQSPGSSVGDRIEKILENIDESEYIFLK